MTSATLEGVTGRNIPIQSVNFTCTPMFESVSNGLSFKRGVFQFSPIDLFITERSENWSPISKFRGENFMDTGKSIAESRYLSVKILKGVSKHSSPGTARVNLTNLCYSFWYNLGHSIFFLLSLSAIVMFSWIISVCR